VADFRAMEGTAKPVVRQAFRIGMLHLLAPFENASELLDLPQIYHLPRAREGLLGVVNLHGRILPLFDLAPTLLTEHLPKVKRMLLVLGHGDDAAGIVVDGLPRRMAFDLQEKIEASEAGLNDATLVTNAWKQLNQPWIELNYPRIFDNLTARTPLQ
jgi:twitching motility protein PilI